MLEVRAFGAVEGLLDGERLSLGGLRQRSVLAVLVAAEGRTVSTDRMLDDLWESEPHAQALGALQVYVSRLRSALEPERPKRRPATVLVSTAPGYALALPTEAVDTWHFAALVRRAVDRPDGEAMELLDRALRLWTDTPFAAYRDQEWADHEITRLTEIRAEAVELRAAAALRLGRSAEVLLELDDHVRAHPLREQAVALQARTLYAAGRQGEALGALRGLRERLVEELGVDPTPETRALEGEILAQDPRLTSARPAVTTSSALAAPEARVEDDDLVGREDELARLSSAAAATVRRPGVVWVEAEAGFGKSALVERFRDLVPSGWTTLRGRCSEVAGAPPGVAWLDVLGDLGQRAPAGADAFTLAGLVRDGLAALDGPALVVLDDVHRADDDTLQVVRHLLDAVRGPLLVVATFRPHEVDRDLATTLALTTEHTLDRLTLGGLGPADAATLLRRHLDSDRPVDDRTVRRLVERAAGNPLFLRHLARLVVAEGADAVEALPAAIRDLLGRRIDALPPATVEALSKAAVLGRDLDFDLVLAVEREHGQGDEDALADHLDGGLVAGLLDSPRPGELRFVHALVRDTLYERLAPLKRHRLHRSALAVMEREHPERLDELAHHATASLDRRSAPAAYRHLRDAAARASDRHAAAYLRTALRALDLVDAPPLERLPVRLDLVTALARDGDVPAALAAREEALAVAREHGTDADVARAWRWRAPQLWPRSEASVSNADALGSLQVLVERFPDDPALTAELLASIAFEANPWDRDVLADAAGRAERLATEVGDPDLLCRALNAQYFAALHGDDVGLLERVGERMLGVASAAGLHGYVALAHLMLQSAAIGRADLGAAGDHVVAATQAGISGQLPELLLLSDIFDALTRLLEGRLDASRAAFDRVLASVAAPGNPNAAMIDLWVRVAVEFAAGDLAPLLPRIKALEAALPDLVNDLWVAALLDAGDVEQARSAWRAVDHPRETTWLLFTALQAHNAAALGDAARAKRLYDDLLPWSGRLTHTLNGALSLGPVDHFLGLLASALGDEPAARRHHDAALRLADASAPVWGAGWVRRRSAPAGG